MGDWKSGAKRSVRFYCRRRLAGYALGVDPPVSSLMQRSPLLLTLPLPRLPIFSLLPCRQAAGRLAAHQRGHHSSPLQAGAAGRRCLPVQHPALCAAVGAGAGPRVVLAASGGCSSCIAEQALRLAGPPSSTLAADICSRYCPTLLLGAGNAPQLKFVLDIVLLLCCAVPNPPLLPTRAGQRRIKCVFAAVLATE